MLVLQDKAEGVDAALRRLAGVRGVETVRTADGYPAYRVLGKGNADLCPSIYDLARPQNWPLRELHRDVRTLETVFNQLAHDRGSTMKQTLSITRKELSAYFGSPMALIFVGVFLAVTLFVFFWVGAPSSPAASPTCARSSSWMPILLIFLVAALTMRQWSEEQRSGTLEVLLTLPVSNWQLVLGKFLAVMALVAVSLALTLFLPITVSLIGNLDWGPVVGGYLAALLLAGAYAAIGLFISSRTDNQIVALILTVLVCGLFYVVGSTGITGLLGRTTGRRSCAPSAPAAASRASSAA